MNLTDQQQAWQLLEHVDAIMEQMFGIPAKPLVLPFGDGTACDIEEVME